MLAKDANRTPMVVVGALQIQAHFSLARKIQLRLHLVPSVKNHGIPTNFWTVVLPIVGFLLFRCLGRGCSSSSAPPYWQLDVRSGDPALGLK